MLVFNYKNLKIKSYSKEVEVNMYHNGYYYLYDVIVDNLKKKTIDESIENIKMLVSKCEGVTINMIVYRTNNNRFNEKSISFYYKYIERSNENEIR